MKEYLHFATTEEYLAFKKAGKKFVEPKRLEEPKAEPKVEVEAPKKKKSTKKK